MRNINIVINRKLLIVIVILVLLLGILILIKTGKGGDSISFGRIKKIQSPYEIQRDETVVEFKTKGIDISTKRAVFKVEEYNTKDFLRFVENYFPIEQKYDFSEVQSFYSQRGIITYNPDEALLYFLADSELKVDMTIRDKDDITIFLSEYFNIQKLKLEEVDTTNYGHEYRGRYQIEDIEYGSPALGGDAFVVKTDRDGTILEFTLLLIKNENITLFQNMPLSKVEELLSDTKYPKLLKHRDVENRYYTEPSSFNLEEYFVKDIEFTYQFNNVSNGYILPTYILKGEGRLVNEKGEKVWSQTDMYVCAINPSYLTEKPRELESEDGYHDQPFPNPDFTP